MVGAFQMPRHSDSGSGPANPPPVELNQADLSLLSCSCQTKGGCSRDMLRLKDHQGQTICF